MYSRSRKEYIGEVVCTIIVVNRRFTERWSHTAFVFIIMGASRVMRSEARKNASCSCRAAHMYHISILAADTMDPNAYQGSSITTSVEMFPPVHNGLLISSKIALLPEFNLKWSADHATPTMYLMLSIGLPKIDFSMRIFCFASSKSRQRGGSCINSTPTVVPVTECLRNASILSMTLYL